MAVFGDTLRQARAYKGVTLKEAEQATRINRHHLAALEEEHFAALPPLIYQRGIVRNYATYLDLDANKLLGMFEEARGGDVDDDPEVVVNVRPLDMPSHWAPNFAIIAFMVVMSAIVFAWLYSAYFAPAEARSTPTPIIATVTPVDSDELIIPTPTAKPATPTVESTEEPSPTPEATATPTEPATEEPEEETVAASASDEEATIEEDATVEEEEPIDFEEDTPTVDSEDGVASINITAEGDIYVIVTADGTVVFEGNLAAGETTGWHSATAFEVYTSDGSLTLFTNEAGESFYMGYGTDEVYPLAEDPSS